MGSPASLSSSQPTTTAITRWWWVGLLLIVIVAATLRLLSYDFSLPYIDHLDEPNKYLGALEWRGLYDSGGYYAGNPPAYIAANFIAQHLFEWIGQPGMPQVIRLLRLVSIAADLLTIIFIALSVRLAGSPFAALIAGTSWALAPLVLENNVYALPDPLNVLLAALAIWLAANAILVEGRAMWAVWSVIAGLLATLLKYPAFPAIIPGGIAVLVLARRNPRVGLRHLLLAALIVGGTLFWLFFIYGIPINSLEREGATIRTSGLANMLDLTRLANNLYFTFYPLNPAAFALLFTGGAAAFIVGWRRSHAIRPRLWVALLCLAMTAGVVLFISSYSLVQANYRMRDVLPASAAAAILLGLAIAQIIQILPPHRQIIGRIAIIAALGIGVYIPQLGEDMTLVQERRRPDLRVDLRQWFDTNLEPGTVLVDESNHKTFNPFWGGLPYRHWFDWWETENFMEHPVSEWRDQRGMSYAVIPLKTWQTMRESEAGQTFLDAMLHLRDFTSPEPVRGPEMVIYRLRPMQHETSVGFGDHILLAGYDQSDSPVQPGDTVEFRLYWNVPTTPENNYSLFIHLVREDDYTVLAQFDGPPAAPERLTLTWDDPDETLISPALPLTIPPDTAPGTYRVMIGLYNFETGERLPVAGGDENNAYPLADIVVAG